MLSNLAEYYRTRFKGASAGMNDLPPSNFSRYSGEAEQAWKSLSDSLEAGFYKPFTDRLRMHTNAFHWKAGTAHTGFEGLVLTTGEVSPPAPLHIPAACRLRWLPAGENIRCYVDGPVKRAWLLEKPLPSSTFWHRLPMRLDRGAHFAEVARRRCGMCLAAEIELDNGLLRRIPSALGSGGDLLSARPYEIVPAQTGPTPQIYNAGEALNYLDPSSLDPSKYGTLLVAPRATTFFRSFNRATRRKLLEPVSKGMNLLILQQDYLSGRNSLDFLPSPPPTQAAPNNGLFEPDGALGLTAIKSPEIMWQHFLPSKGWEVYGNGGVAHLKLGKGNVWLVNGRFMQQMTTPAGAKALKTVMESTRTGKPVVVLDQGSESAIYTTSLYSDLLNAMDIPFLTLGEVIAKEQGMNSFTVIPGPAADDDVLGGKGAQMANTFLRNRVISMAKRPDPKSIPEFETERTRRKAELMKSLGLDPMPPKTPLNARITGRLQRNGYHIEKLVFESRPNFFVTGHVYVPDHMEGKKLPIVVHVNGHWAHKKDEDRIQLRAAFCALQGYLAIAIDSPGHSYEGDALIERRPEGDHNDWTLVEGGSNATGYYVWDAIRALDYMATRPDADMSRIGITGASGGGLATLYTFAVDDRYKAAVPVVYMASLELAPDNGCLCNHVPGTAQVGDRSDVLAIQAPKPVYIMGAQLDGEFPPEATRLTHKKLQPTWDLFGKASDTYVQIYAGGHDYNQPMRESMIGFFNRYVKGVGDGAPVPQPKIEIYDSEDHQLLALDPPAPNERTMRDLSQEYLSEALAATSREQVIAINGGMPVGGDLKYQERGIGSRRLVTFESEPGLVTPGILMLPKGPVRTVKIVVSDAGKKVKIESTPPAEDGVAMLFLDTLGTGELAEIEQRYPIYAGRSVAYTAGWQIAQAAAAMSRYSRSVSVEGYGPLSSESAMYAGILDPKLDKVSGWGCMHAWSDVFRPDVLSAAVQPRAHLCGSLEAVRALVPHGEWHLR